MIKVDPAYLKNTGELLHKTGNAIHVIATLINENQNRIESPEQEGVFLNGYSIGGLIDAIELLSASITEIGFNVEGHAEKHAQAEKKKLHAVGGSSWDQ